MGILITLLGMTAVGCFTAAYFYWYAISVDDVLLDRHGSAEVAVKQSQFDRYIRSNAMQIAHFFPIMRQRMLTYHMQKQIVYAGPEARLSHELFWGIRLLALLAGIYAGIMLSVLMDWNLIFTLLAGLVVGFIWPIRWLNKIAKMRQEQLDLLVPEMLDLLTISLEAGMGFEPALDMTVGRIREPLREEMRRMLIDIQLGIPFVQALERLVERTNSADLHEFLQSLILAKRLGTPLVESIIEQAEAINSKRIAKVKERVNKVIPRASGVLAVLTVLGMGVMVLGLLILSLFIELGAF